MTLSDATREKIAELVVRFPNGRTPLLPALKLAQDEVGYLPPEVSAEVAELVGVPASAAAELVTFYTMLREHKSGEYHVTVCVQLPCAVRGANKLVRDLSAAFGIEPGETTADGAVTLESTPECFGSCHRAPMARVNDEYWENLDAQGMERMIRKLSVSPSGSSAGRA